MMPAVPSPAAPVLGNISVDMASFASPISAGPGVGMQSISHAFSLPGLSPASDTATATTESSSSVLRSPDTDGRNGAPHSLSTAVSERACQKCRASKRRCDKALPYCTRCTRLGASCVYLADTVTGPSTTTNQAPLAALQSQALSKSEFLCAPDPLAELTAPLILSLVFADAAPGEQQLDWTDGVRAYYNCVHKWYSVVHRGLFDCRIDSLCTSADSPPAPPSYSPSGFSGGCSFTLQKGSADWSFVSTKMSRELALLILAMYLSARTCSTRAGRNRTMFDSLYRIVRRSFALGISETTTPRIEFVQIGALLALYEYGHSNSPLAYRTLSETVAAARVLGIQPGCTSDRDLVNANGISSMEQEQNSAVWWSSFILDQLIHRDEASTHLPFILESPEPITLLPEPGQNSTGRLQSRPRYQPRGPSNRRLPVSMGVNVNLMESFQISAKVASLLHRALRHNYETRMRVPGTLPPVETFAPLDQEIRNMTATLLKDATDWRYALDCFAMCCSALFTLYLPFLPILEAQTATQISNNNELRTALAALRFAAQLSSDITCKMNSEITDPEQELSCRELAVLAAPTCFLVVKVYTGLRIICPEEYQKCQDAILDKYKSLKFFRCRWGIAGTFTVIVLVVVDQPFFSPGGMHNRTNWLTHGFVRLGFLDKLMSQLNDAYGIDWYRCPEVKPVAYQSQNMKDYNLLPPPPPHTNGITMNSEGNAMDLS
ncbi:uncharacterized protein PG986_008005 [Apiospora aurea]|uniref:Zn(2)-C6 fungal-type domain-containing protein n=1 Tax=Apiospora aurea TaxID=335848 RepID=A0ABR1QEI5_9PEZI